ISISTYPSNHIYLSIHIHPSRSISIDPYLYPSTHPYIYPSTHPYIYPSNHIYISSYLSKLQKSRVALWFFLSSDYSIEETVSMITEKADSDLEKIRAIWIWICHNIRYDVEGFLGLSPKIYHAKEVVKTGKAVCSGYAGLFKEMCRHIGIKCREVSGYSRGSEYIEGLGFHRTKSNHMWNALELDSEWYLLDACWGAGTVNLQERIFIPSYDDFYFFTDPEDFIETHWPDDPTWQLLESTVSFEMFERNVFKTSEFFNGCNHEEDLIVASGSLTVIFKTSRPLLAMYELGHKQLSGPMGKKCFMSQIEETQLSCHLLLPYLGYYRLSLFVKNISGEHYKNVANLLIRCTNPINHNELFPPELSVHCGPGVSTKLNGLIDPSHPHPLINTSSGACTITFHTSTATEVLSVLEQNIGRNHLYSLDRYCLVTHLEHKISISLHLPTSGCYKLSVFARNQEKAPEFSHVCNYVIRCLADNHMLPFPKVYSAWRQGCILLKPRAGLLASESWETFRVKIAGAHKVVVIGPKKTELQLTKNKIWEGRVYTGPPGSLLKLAVKSSQNANTMDIVMSFKSQTNFSVNDGTSG
uniref:Transglutaminase-like domain-containing protein n=1 Tax=Leptobrachium leishanense TaxID=445787 RepID=A0A8C5WJ60_9ANUR